MQVSMGRWIIVRIMQAFMRIDGFVQSRVLVADAHRTGSPLMPVALNNDFTFILKGVIYLSLGQAASGTLSGR